MSRPESREATHEWITEFVHDHPYAHGLADDMFDLVAERDALKAALEATADALREWQGFGRVPGGGYNGDLPVRTESALLVAEALLADTEEKP